MKGKCIDLFHVSVTGARCVGLGPRRAWAGQASHIQEEMWNTVMCGAQYIPVMFVEGPWCWRVQGVCGGEAGGVEEGAAAGEG